MSKNVVTILFLTLITIVFWVGFQIFKVNSESTIPQPTEEQLRPLDPTLDKSVFEDLKKSIQ